MILNRTVVPLGAVTLMRCVAVRIGLVTVMHTLLPGRQVAPDAAEEAPGRPWLSASTAAGADVAAEGPGAIRAARPRAPARPAAEAAERMRIRRLAEVMMLSFQCQCTGPPGHSRAFSPSTRSRQGRAGRLT